MRYDNCAYHTNNAKGKFYIYWQLYEKTKNKNKRGQEWPKINLSNYLQTFSLILVKPKLFRNQLIFSLERIRASRFQVTT